MLIEVGGERLTTTDGSMFTPSEIRMLVGNHNRLGGNLMYMIYENPKTSHLVPVKASFQWMAFLAPNYWAWIKGMTNLGWIHTVIIVVLGWLVLPYIIQIIYAGVKAGEHHANYLQQHGYEERGSIMALNEFDAIQKFHDDKTSSS